MEKTSLIYNWALLTLRRRWVITVPAAVVATVLIGVMAILVCLSSSIKTQATDALIRNGSLGQVDVIKSVDSTNQKALSSDAIAAIRSTGGVNSAEPDYWVDLPWGDEGALLSGRTYQQHRPLLIKAGKAGVIKGEVLLPETVDGKPMDQYIGKMVKINIVVKVGTNKGKTVDNVLKVAGIYSMRSAPEWPNTAFLSRDDSLEWAALREGMTPELFGRTVGADDVLVQTASVEAARSVATTLRAQGFDAHAVAERAEDLSGIPGLIVYGSWVLVAICLIFLTASTVQRGHRATDRRLREFAVLRALGWSKRHLVMLIWVESAIVGLGTALTGIMAGVLTAQIFVPSTLSIMFEASHATSVPVAALAGLALTLVIAGLAGSWLGVRRALSGDPYLVARIGRQ